VHLISVQEVGCTLLMFGTEQQRDRWLLDIAAGKLLASILLSEWGAGSDITLLETTATPDQDDGWRISGSKIWSMYTDWSGIALCSAKTRDSDSRYNSISLFMVDLSAPGVTVTPVPRLAGEPYFLVGLDNVYVGPGALVGALHRGWSLLQTSIGFERGGLDYLTQGWSWLHAIEEEFQRLPASRQTELAGDLVRLRCRLESARALAFQAAYAASGLEMDEIAAAYAKLACGQAAQAVARWAGEEFLPALGHRPSDSAGAILRTAIAEAPELTISAGALDLQLSLIAHEFPIGREVR
jgi:3-oxo-4-pregnene-20-carboxyl-CoA dehydrogenase beta subunit